MVCKSGYVTFFSVNKSTEDYRNFSVIIGNKVELSVV